MVAERTTDLYRWGCSRPSILSRFCLSGCLTVKGRAQFGVAATLSKAFMPTHTWGWPYFKGLVAIHFAGDGWDVTLGHSLVTLATAAAAALALIDLSHTGPHCYATATLWGFKRLKGLWAGVASTGMKKELNLCVLWQCETRTQLYLTFIRRLLPLLGQHPHFCAVLPERE